MGTVYRQPYSLVEWYNDFIEMYDHAYAEENKIIILGDINLDFLKFDNVPNRWTPIIDMYQLTQIIDKPITITKTSKSYIDHIYVTNPEHVREAKVPHFVLSDHFPACYVRKHHASHHMGVCIIQFSTALTRTLR